MTNTDNNSIERRAMTDRRESVESRLSMLEYKVTQQDIFLKQHLEDSKEDKEEILKILTDIRLHQGKTQTVLGGITFLVAGFVTAVWDMLQTSIQKLFH